MNTCAPTQHNTTQHIYERALYGNTLLQHIITNMSLEERTLVVRSNSHTFDEKITRDLLWELFLQSGPVKNVVLRPDHAFIEFYDKCSVGYALALMEGTTLYGQQLVLSPKIESQETFKYVTAMESFNNAMKYNPYYFYEHLPKGFKKDTRSDNTSQYQQQRNYSNDNRNYRDSDKMKYSSYSDLNRSHNYSDLNRSYPNYSSYSDLNRSHQNYSDLNRSYTNYSDNRQQRDSYDQFNRRHSYNNNQQYGYNDYQRQQQQQQYNRSFSNNFR